MTSRTKPSGRRRILFVAHPCYLDDSNGAAVASRAMMESLGRLGFVVEAFSSTVLSVPHEVNFDEWLGARGLPFHKTGGASCAVDMRGVWSEEPHKYRLHVRGVPVTLYQSPYTLRHAPSEIERSEFLKLFDEVLLRFQPDVLVNYGGDVLAHELRSRARARGASVVFALHNFSYRGTQPFTTTDAVIVPSQFAADHYRRALGLDCQVLPNLIDFSRVRVNERSPRFLTFVNPSFEKGVYAFTRIADELGRLRPDIPLLVVEGRGDERTLVDCGIDLRVHGNVFLMSLTSDPRDFWRVTKVCLMPSLWWENQPLVAIEAMSNGIPVIGSDRGGIPETLGNAGIVLPLPQHLTPETRNLPSAEEVAPWIEAVIRLWDDNAHYAEQRRLASDEALRWAVEALEPLYLKFFDDIRPSGKALIHSQTSREAGSVDMPSPN